MAHDGIADVVIVRGLRAVEQDGVFYLGGIADDAACADERVAADKCAGAHLGLRPDDSGACNVDVRVKLGAFRDPHVFAALLVFLGRKCFAERFNELADLRQRLPRVGAGFKQRARRGVAEII